MRRIIPSLTAAVCLLCLTACSLRSDASLRKFTATRLDMFDTVIILTGYAASEAEFNEIAQSAFNELYDLHRLYDVYNEYDGISNICTINSCAGGEAVRADQRIIDLLLLSREIIEASGGCMDITAGSILKLWHNARTDSMNNPELAYIPDDEALRLAAEHTGFDLLEIDETNGTVRLSEPEALLDVGAIAKGYAVDLISGSLPEGWLISAGGNICSTGCKPDGESWKVGIQDPDGDPSDIVCKLSLDKGAVVTSGDYQRTYAVNGVQYHHIIDLQTLRPADRWSSVSIICENSGIADGLSTALFVLSREEGEKILSLYDAEALWIDQDGGMQYSDGFEKYIIQ